MALLGNQTPVIEASRFALDLVFKHNALLLNDLLALGLGTFSFPVPLVGFTYENPSSLELLNYSYSEYPYLTKTLIANSYVKNNTQLSIRSYRAITSVNSVITNIAINEALTILIEKYCDRGGTFSCFTMWGFISNLVVERLEIIPADDNQLGGVGFQWTFKKINFDTSSVDSVISKKIQALQKGTVV